MKVLRKLLKANYFIFLLIFFLAVLLISFSGYLFNFPDYATENTVVDEFKKYPVISYIMLTVILVPFLETLIFQGFVIEVIRLITRKKRWFCWSVSLSAFLFGIAHSYNIYYVFMGIIVGLLFALAYYLTIYRKESPVLTVTIIHGLVNLATFFDEFYF